MPNKYSPRMPDLFIGYPDPPDGAKTVATLEGARKLIQDHGFCRQVGFGRHGGKYTIWQALMEAAGLNPPDDPELSFEFHEVRASLINVHTPVTEEAHRIWHAHMPARLAFAALQEATHFHRIQSWAVSLREDAPLLRAFDRAIQNQAQRPTNWPNKSDQFTDFGSHVSVTFDNGVISIRDNLLLDGPSET